MFSFENSNPLTSHDEVFIVPMKTNIFTFVNHHQKSTEICSSHCSFQSTLKSSHVLGMPFRPNLETFLLQEWIEMTMRLAGRYNKK